MTKENYCGDYAQKVGEIVCREIGRDYGLENVSRLGKSSHLVLNITLRNKRRTLEFVGKIEPEVSYVSKDYNLAREIRIMQEVGRQGPLFVPEIVYSDLSKTTIPYKFFVMEKVSGISLQEMLRSASQTDKERLVSLTGCLLAKINGILVGEETVGDKTLFMDNLLGKIGQLISAEQNGYTDREKEILGRSIDIIEQKKCVFGPQGLLNGDPSAEHFIWSNNKWYVLDWDSARNGPTGWDCYWMTGGGVSFRVFEVENALEMLLESFENERGEEIEGKEVLQLAALTYRHTLGHYIHSQQLNPIVCHFYPIYKPRMEELMVELLEKM